MYQKQKYFICMSFLASHSLFYLNLLHLPLLFLFIPPDQTQIIKFRGKSTVYCAHQNKKIHQYVFVSTSHKLALELSQEHLSQTNIYVLCPPRNTVCFISTPNILNATYTYSVQFLFMKYLHILPLLLMLNHSKPIIL